MEKLLLLVLSVFFYLCDIFLLTLQSKHYLFLLMDKDTDNWWLYIGHTYWPKNNDNNNNIFYF